MNAINLLKEDHRKVEALFEKFQAMVEKGRASATSKQAVVQKIIKELTIHAAIEEQLLYPRSRGIEEAEDLTLEALEEHQIAKRLLAELDGMSPDHERFEAKVMVLIESVKHHVKEEEREMFPKLRREMDRAELEELGVELARAKKTAPKTPAEAATRPGTPRGAAGGKNSGKVAKAAKPAPAGPGRGGKGSKKPAGRRVMNGLGADV